MLISASGSSSVYFQTITVLFNDDSSITFSDASFTSLGWEPGKVYKKQIIAGTGKYELEKGYVELRVDVNKGRFFQVFLD